MEKICINQGTFATIFSDGLIHVTHSVGKQVTHMIWPLSGMPLELIPVASNPVLSVRLDEAPLFTPDEKFGDAACE